MSDRDASTAHALVEDWLLNIVIGLGLCPFAKKPADEKTIAIHVVYPSDEEALLAILRDEMERLDREGTAVVETSLIVLPELLADFYDYNQFLVWANQLIKRNGWKGVYQLASFHPNYVFAGVDEDDAGNFTNRAPFPVIHIIREASLEKALAYYPDIDSVPERNQALMDEMTQTEREKLFHYLYR